MRTWRLAVLVVGVVLAGCGSGDPVSERGDDAASSPEDTVRLSSRRSTTTLGADEAPGDENDSDATAGDHFAPAPLRSADWDAVLAADPRWSYEPQDPAAPTPVGPRVTWANVVAGNAVISSISFADLDGDGNEEAVIPLASGGTAGDTGVLVYTAGPAGPTLVGPESFYRSFGYKTSTRLTQRELLVSNVVGAGFEPNCCFSGQQTRSFGLIDGQLMQQGEVEETGFPGARPFTVEVFYQRINARQFEAAYAFLTPAAQAREPFETWRAGFDTTESVEATADGTNGEDPTKPVRFTLLATDRSAAGSTSSRSFAGSWTLIYSPERHQWLLDVAEVKPI